MNEIRIAVDGAASTGKSTLTRELAAQLGSEFVVIPEAARVVAPEFGISSSRDWGRLLDDRQRLREFFLREHEWQLQAEAEAGCKFIADGSALLIHAYKSLLTSEVGFTRDAERYDLILYCCLNDSADEDGFRDTSFRVAFDTWYRQNVIPMVRIQVVDLEPGADRTTKAADKVRRLFPATAPSG